MFWSSWFEKKEYGNVNNFAFFVGKNYYKFRLQEYKGRFDALKHDIKAAMSIGNEREYGSIAAKTHLKYGLMDYMIVINLPLIFKDGVDFDEDTIIENVSNVIEHEYVHREIRCVAPEVFSSSEEKASEEKVVLKIAKGMQWK